MHHIIYNSPVGDLHLTADDTALLSVAVTPPTVQNLDANPNFILAQASRELTDYFAGQRTTFTVPYRQPSQDTFRGRAQQALTTIPYGATRTYRQLATDLANPGATRAVGTACATNPLLIIIPCHRVIRHDGSMGQYAGGIPMKQHLLALEQA